MFLRLFLQGHCFNVMAKELFQALGKPLGDHGGVNANSKDNANKNNSLILQ
jgi:hypothetical protein